MFWADKTQLYRDFARNPIIPMKLKLFIYLYKPKTNSPRLVPI